MKRKYVIIILCFVIIMGNVAESNEATIYNIIRYSEDYFSGDSTHGNSIKEKFTDNGYSVNIGSRPTTVAGVNSGITSGKTYYISTHGASSGSCLKLSNSVWYETSDVPNTVYSDFIYLSACYSAKTGSGGNLCYKFYSKGAQCVVGYAESVPVNSSRWLEKVFYSKFISDGNSVSTAMNTAKIYTRAIYGENDASCSSVTIYGYSGYTY